MVAREGIDGWLLLSNADVAELAETLAGRFGNDRFEPGDACVVGALQRLARGWREHETTLRLGTDGRPIEREPIELCFSAWSAATRPRSDGDVDDDAEALLLTSIVAMQLAADATESRPGREAATAGVEQLRERFNHNKFYHAQIELQEGLRRQLGLATDRPLRLGLAETFDDPEEFALVVQAKLTLAMLRISELLSRGSAGATSPVFDPDSGDHVPITLRPLQSSRWLVVPWCFREAEVSLRLPCRAITEPPDPTGAVAFNELPVAPMDVLLIGRI
jgi:hypothetical protein